MSTEKDLSNTKIETTKDGAPTVCIKGCGFFGNPAFGNMCSSCYKKNPPPPVSSSLKEEKKEELVDKSSEGGVDSGKKVQNNKNRCFQCKKKIGFSGVECRCGFVFCGEHRIAESHSCDFDYKASNKANLEKKNPVITAAKLSEKL